MRLVLFIAGTLLSHHASAQQAWYLMSRHGECSAITPAMRHKFPDFPEVYTPEALLQALKERKADATGAPVPDAPEGYRSVAIPSLGWSLIVVRADRCRSFAKGPR